MTATESDFNSPDAPATAVTRHRLDNGLDVVIVSDHSVPVVGVNLTYRVGSRNEVQGRTGFAHLFEHLMFQGSQNVAAGEHSAVLARAGGSPNAATNFDWTMYHQAVPVGALELALWFEADRMGGMLAALDQAVLDNEREVVKNEKRERMDNQPYGDSWEILTKALFPAPHPYSWLPIGSMADIDAATLDDVRAFFELHYGPNNCVLALAGDITPEHGIELVERYFGGVPSNPRIPTQPSTELGKATGEVRLQAPNSGPVPAVITTYRGPAFDHPQSVALTIACRILAGDDSSRMVDRFVRREQMVSEIQGGYDPTWGQVAIVAIQAFLAGETTFEQFEKVRDEEINRFITDGVTAAEVARAVAQTERDVWEGVSTVEGMAQAYAETGAFRPGYDPITDFIAELNALTPETVRAAAAEWLTIDNRVVLTYEGETYEDFDQEFEESL